MMLPSAAPMILLYARVARGQGAAGVLPPTFVFAGAYVAVWTAFSILATAAQWGLSESGLIGDAMRLNDRTLGGALLIGAGLFQLTPLKRLCLEHCRGPVAFLTLHWRPGFWGALRMGLHHGAFCVGCCWFIMALLFVGGVMNLVWVVAIAVFVLAEKVLRFGPRIGQAAGALAIAAGAYLIVA
jgi:predicted metal-binding membrane protein